MSRRALKISREGILAELCLLETSLSKKLQILTRISSEPLCMNILHVNKHLLLLYNRQNLTDLGLLLGKLLVMNSYNLVVWKWQRYPTLFISGRPERCAARGAPLSELQAAIWRLPAFSAETRSHGAAESSFIFPNFLCQDGNPALHLECLEVKTPFETVLELKMKAVAIRKALDWCDGQQISYSTKAAISRQTWSFTEIKVNPS